MSVFFRSWRNRSRRKREKRHNPLPDRAGVFGVFCIARNPARLEHSRSPEDILLEREEMTTRLYLIAALPVALAHATPTQARRVHAYYIAGIKQPEISRREGVHSSKVSVAIRRGLRNMRRCYDDLFQTE